MSGASMDVFALRESVVRDYERFATSFTTIRADDIRSPVDAIYAKARYWPDPLIQINPNFERGPRIDQLVKSGVLHPRMADIFRTDNVPAGETLELHRHQEEAIALAQQGVSYVVTTGTGSGKSLCFFLPIVDAILKEKDRGARPRTRAVIIYPMNALANSQLEEIEKFIKRAPGAPPVTVARYTGQESQEQREAVADHPPDILLTNFMMLELLMTRQEEVDRRVMKNCEGLRFLVLDELHTYRGRQGADVALLVRRVRERLSTDLQCIGTSATMASEGSAEDKQQIVADVAGKLFASPISASHVVIERLQLKTRYAQLKSRLNELLGPAIDRGMPGDVSDEELAQHPLAVWTETQLGVTFTEQNPAWHRARPRTLDDAANELARAAGRPVEACRRALRDLLFVASTPERDRSRTGKSERSFFPFKLHQFISGAGHAYATLELPPNRRVTVEGQKFLPQEPGSPLKRLYPVHFCRTCGHEYHPVRRISEEGKYVFLDRDIDDAPVRTEDEELEEVPETEAFGFLTLVPPASPRSTCSSATSSPRRFACRTVDPSSSSGTSSGCSETCPRS